MTVRAFLGLLAVSLLATTAKASTYESHECFSKDLGRRIQACGQLLAQPDLAPNTRSTAYAMRALALSVLGRYPEAIADYDEAIALNPYYAIALNNRAWAHFRSGNISAAWPDVRRSLRIDPFSPHAHDTRGHLHHAEGRPEAAYNDYRRAMQFGGTEMVKLYQCGLQSFGHYTGPRNGLVSDELLLGLKACSADKKCDPLPPDEECTAATS